MTELGYEPRVPEKRTANRQLSYLSYVDPVDGRNLINAHSRSRPEHTTSLERTTRHSSIVVGLSSVQRA